MNQHSSFDLPLCLVVDEDVFGRVDEIVAQYIPDIKGKKSLIVTEKFLHDLYGDIVAGIQKDFSDADVVEVVSADYDEAVGFAKKIAIEDIKVVIGFGGGRVLDVAKYAAYVSKAVYICLPTNLSNDSLASPFSVLGTEGSDRKTLPCMIPAAILVDTDMIQKAPASQTIGGIGDTIAKYTAVFDWSLSALKEDKPVDDFAHTLATMCFESVAYCEEKSLQSKAFIKILARALVMGGLAMEIAGSSRPCSGSEHLFCHAIEELYPNIKISHGYAAALGSVGAANFQGRDDTKVIEVCKAYGLDLNPAIYGIDKDLFAKIWSKAAGTRPDRYTILNTTELDREWLDQIYDRMCM